MYRKALRDNTPFIATCSELLVNFNKDELQRFTEEYL
ncbi:hypothetical protein T01_14074 [Trichinella spiralis]|uniref:Uncharacterized protein n=1 Tax=Trichinella spiralis TaxID=6334 RepID=A0A0V0Z2F5_TRISP|nr:hypothetical protein T01_14074 [Trichinella spiralis]